jgi:uroporphyrinogen decarboxylase
MSKITTHERFSRIFKHQESDRIPIYDGVWEGTIRRWHREGIPDNVSYVDYFNLDKIAHISVDVTPRYEEKVLEETSEYKVYTTKWGATLKSWKFEDSTPEFINFTVIDRDKWLEAKKRMVPTEDRINWNYLKKNYKRWREEGYWIEANLWFGFDVTHSWTVGTERFLIALVEEPDWCVDMFNHFLDVNIALLEMVWDAGYTFDSIQWPDDMGYKHSQFFSVKMYKDLLKPIHKRAIDWAHSKGAKTHLHSCGDINPFIPELIEIGLDALNPIEVKAGMNPIELKKKYGRDLVLHGGINAVLWDDAEAIEEELRRVIPIIKEGGGYIFSSDHSIPNTVSLENFKKIIDLVKELGSY